MGCINTISSKLSLIGLNSTRCLSSKQIRHLILSSLNLANGYRGCLRRGADNLGIRLDPPIRGVFQVIAIDEVY